MKYKTLFIVTSIFFLATSCGEEIHIPTDVEIELNAFDTSSTVHTIEQKALLEAIDPVGYVDDNVDNLGKTSLSKPKPINLSWSETNELSQPASSYSVTVSESNDLSNPLVFTSYTTNVDISNLKLNTKYYYQVTSNHYGTTFDSEISNFTINDSAPRNIFVEGVENVRDLGGWNIGESKTYKQGMIFRTAQFNYGGDNNDYVSAPTELGKYTLLNELKIKTEIDLRRTISFDGFDEVAGITSSPLGDSVNYVSTPMFYGRKNIFTTASNKSSIQAFFNTLANPNNYPIAFHCLRGTDRTGALAYVLGALVGMSESDLMLDYLFSDLANIGDPVTASVITANDFFIKGIEKCSGETLSERTMNYLYNTCEVSRSTLESIIDILTE